MQSPTSPRLFLSRAVHLSLLAACVAVSPLSAVANPVKAVQDRVESARELVVFGDAAAISHAGDLAGGNREAIVTAGGRLDGGAIERLTATTADAIAVVAASELATLGEDGATLSRLFEAGVPVFVCTDGEHAADVAHMFGMAAPTGDAIYVRDPSGSTTVLGDAGNRAHWTPAWSRNAAASLNTFRTTASARIMVPSAAPSKSEVVPGLPMFIFHEGVIDTGTDEISGRATIKVIRSATRTEDEKSIEIHSWPIVTPKDAGIHEGHTLKPAVNLTAAYLPWKYTVAHRVSADGAQPELVDSLPESDSRTDFEREWKKTRSISIGGGTGEGASADGLPDAVLAAKVPFNLSFSYSNTTEETVRSSFKDFSLLARPVDGGKRMMWEASIAPSLRHNLVEQVGADRVWLTDKHMTPMMRSATLESWSAWELPGEYEGMARVELDVGYELNAKTWWWEGTDFLHKEETTPVGRTKTYLLDLSHPFLTRETTVLIRSAMGSGGCLAAQDDEVALKTCNAASRAQMWGLDSEQRYVNRETGRCLEADMASAQLRMAACTLENNQVWQWRADRVHSGYDPSLRLHVDGGEPRFMVDGGSFDTPPENPHNPILRPWSSYPSAPIAGELIPAPFGVVPGTVTSEFATRHGAVQPEQRWNLVVLREGLAPAR